MYAITFNVFKKYAKYHFDKKKILESRQFWYYDMIWYEHDETIIIKYDNCGVKLFHLSTSSISASSLIAVQPEFIFNCYPSTRCVPTLLGFPKIYLFNSIECNLSDKIRALFSVIAMGILVRDVSLSGVSGMLHAMVSAML